MKSLIAPLAMIAALLSPASALAHPKLLSATPAAGATVAKPTKLTLNFYEDLVAPLSGIELTMTGMPMHDLDTATFTAVADATPIGMVPKIRTIRSSLPRAWL